MTIRKVEVPGYSSIGFDDKNLIVREFAGRMILTIVNEKGEKLGNIECYFKDLEKAWNAVK